VEKFIENDKQIFFSFKNAFLNLINVTILWKEIGDIKCVIQKLLIKNFSVSHYTPVEKLSEWMSGNYRKIFQVIHFNLEHK
jgi:hypothetical protein